MNAPTASAAMSASTEAAANVALSVRGVSHRFGETLALDNVFVISLIFTAFAIPRLYQHRVLVWGIVGVIVLRAIVIGLGAGLVAQAAWVLYLFAAFLVFTGVKMLFAGGHDSAVQAVYDGDAEVGVSFNDARGQLVDQVPDVGERVVVFAWSFPIPNDGFAVAGPAGREGGVAPFLEQGTPWIPAARQQPEPVDEDDWRPS